MEARYTKHNYMYIFYALINILLFGLNNQTVETFDTLKKDYIVIPSCILLINDIKF